MSKVEMFILYCLLLIGLGATLRMTNAITPIHEVGHVLASVVSGGNGRVSEWSKADISVVTPFTICAGFYSEAIVFAGVFFLTAKKYPLIASVFVGIVPIILLGAFGSEDFNNYLGRDGNVRAKVLWGCFTFALLTAVGIVFILSIVRRAKLIASKRCDKRQNTVVTPSQKVVSSVGGEADPWSYRGPMQDGFDGG